MSLYSIRIFFSGIGIGHSHQVAEPELHSALTSFVFILQHLNSHKEWIYWLYDTCHCMALEIFLVASAPAPALATATRLPSLSCTQHHPHWSSYYNTSIITKSEFTDFIIHVTVWHQKSFRWHRHRHRHRPQPPGCRAWAALGIRLPILSCTQHHPH
jgi:hypothetical protein